MKTSLKREFDKLDIFEEYEKNMEEQTPADSETIKKLVLAQIQAKKSDKFKNTKKRITICLIAAALTIGVVGTTVIGTNGGWGTAFANHFAGEKETVPLYQAKNVQFTSPDENLEAKVLGVIGDESYVYASVELTKKDGSTFAEENCVRILSDTIAQNRIHLVSEEKNFDMSVDIQNKDDTQLSEVGNYEIDYELNEDHTAITLTIRTHTNAGRITLNSKSFGALKSTEKIMECGKTREELNDFVKLCHEQNMDFYSYNFIETEDHYDVYQTEMKKFDLPFELSFDTDFQIQSKTIHLTDEQAYGITGKNIANASLTVSSLGMTASWYNDGDKPVTVLTYLFYQDDSKIYLNDGTQYYITGYEGNFAQGDEISTMFYAAEQGFYPVKETKKCIIDINKISKIILNGYTIYLN